MTKQCSWHGSKTHTCRPSEVHFLLRYQDETDYCVGGQRVVLYDDGRLTATCERTTPEQARQLELHLLDKWVKYVNWQVEQKQRHPACWGDMPPQPIGFHFPIVASE